MQPKVSMVIPCYNKDPYIEKMIQSVYNQVWTNIEVIFVEGGSTDETANIIERWIPKLQNRGYEVIFINQESPDIPGAVLDGMRRMTGEYFCQVDCDDVLYPEYVSTMASFLRDHAVYDWVSCDYESFYMDDDAKLPVRQLFEDSPGSVHMTESFLLHRMCMTVWIYMVRTEYIKRSRLMNNFCLEPPISQEPPIIIPLASNGGKLKHIPIVLYKYNLDSTGAARLATVETSRSFIAKYSKMVENTISRLDICEPELARYLSIARLTQTKWTYLCFKNFCKNEKEKHLLMEKTIDSIKHMLTPVPDISMETLMRANMNVFFRAVENCVLKVRNKYLDFGASINGRIIGYGALSWLALNMLKALVGTAMQPDLLWDKAASAESYQNGVAVVNPDLSQLTPNDTVLIFSNNLYIIDEITAIVKSYGVINVLNYFDVLECLAAHYFPEIQEHCTFTG